MELGGKPLWDMGVPTALVSARGATAERSRDCHRLSHLHGKAGEKKPGVFADSRETPTPCSTRLNRQILLLLPKSCSNPKLIYMEIRPGVDGIALALQSKG